MQTKVCAKCGKEKPISEFSIRKASPDGLMPICKKCDSISSFKFRRTKDGLFITIYNNQISRSKQRNHPMPTYTKEELIAWLLNNPKFNELYDAWVNSNYNKSHAPSIDRINDYKPYTMDNIRLTTWEENLDKYRKDVKNGVNNKQSKAVLQYDLDGNFIKEYYSVAQAKRETNINESAIVRVCKNKIIDGYRCRTTGGYVWKYKDK